MNNSINISANRTDMFNIEIPKFDSGAITTGSNAPENNFSSSEFGVVANKSLMSFGVLLLCIIVFLVIIFIFKNSKKNTVPQRQVYERKRYNSEKVRQEQLEETYEPQRSEQALYRHSSKKRSSLSTPTSINKCIRAFLENTKEN